MNTAFVSLCLNQTLVDPSVRSCGHLCGCHSGYAGGLRETQQRSRQLLVSPECWYAGLLPDRFFLSSPNSLSPALYLSTSLCQRCAAEELSFGLEPARSSSDEHLYTYMIEVWFMRERHWEYSFWHQQQIMKETEWGNLWSLPYH